MFTDKLKKIIDENKYHSIEFGNCDSAPPDDWIEKAEQYLGAKFPPSYVWFLKNCGGGEIHGDEIFSIYEMPFNEVVGGDIVCQTMLDRENGFISYN